MNLEFYGQVFRIMLKCKIPLKSVQWESSCSKCTDGQTIMTKLSLLAIMRTRLKVYMTLHVKSDFHET